MNRQGFIGGSDLYSIMRGDWHDLWLVKTGRKQPDDLSHIFKVQLGTHTEQFNIDWFCNDTGMQLDAHQAEFSKELMGVPFKGTVDGIVLDEHDGKRCLLECKHTSSNRRMVDMIESYMPQVQLYMCLSETYTAYLSVILGNEFDYSMIPYDPAYLTAVVERCATFWQHVVDDTEPEDTGAVRIDWSEISIDGLKIRDASTDNMFVDAAHDYMRLEPYSKEFDKAKKELRQMIADDEREVFCEILSIKRDKRGACRITLNGG